MFSRVEHVERVDGEEIKVKVEGEEVNKSVRPFCIRFTVYDQ